MLYDWEIIVPLNTLASAPVVQRLPLTKGVITGWGVEFRHGCNNMVYLKVVHGIHPVLPANDDGALNLDGVYARFSEHYVMDSEPYELVAQLWSPGTTYPHTVRIEVELMEAGLTEESGALVTGLKKFLNLVGIRI